MAIVWRLVCLPYPLAMVALVVRCLQLLAQLFSAPGHPLAGGQVLMVILHVANNASAGWGELWRPSSSIPLPLLADVVHVLRYASALASFWQARGKDVFALFIFFSSPKRVPVSLRLIDEHIFFLFIGIAI